MGCDGGAAALYNVYRGWLTGWWSFLFLLSFLLGDGRLVFHASGVGENGLLMRLLLDLAHGRFFERRGKKIGMASLSSLGLVQHGLLLRCCGRGSRRRAHHSDVVAEKRFCPLVNGTPYLREGQIV